MDTNVGIPIEYLLTGSNASVATSMLWHLIDWSKVTHVVKSLQIRIAKAVKAKKWQKVKRLQWLLAHNLAAKLLAVRRVTENKGKRTPGIDGKTWKTATDKVKAVHGLRLKGYTPSAVRRIYIPKSNGKKRPLGIPTMHDRTMQALYLQSLEPVSETTGDANSYGFRPNRCCADAIERSFAMLCKKNSPKWVLEADIKGCFDNISHDWLEKNIPLPKKLLKAWLQSGYMEKQRLFPTTNGTPQGSIISPTLANIVLDGLEAHIDTACNIRRNYRNPKHVHFIRYADDFIVTCSDKDYLEKQVKPAIEAFLLPRGLSLSEDKTHLTPIEQGFDFLGQNVRKYDDKLLIKPSKKNIKTFLDKVKGVIQKNRTVRTQHLIELLNPMIRGWALYHRHIAAKRTFTSIDHIIFKMVWQWAKRRHQEKRLDWVKNRYFTRIKDKDWILFDTDRESNKKILLFQAASVPIRRHPKIKTAANPFSLEDEPYFEYRRQLTMSVKWEGRQQLNCIYQRQKGCCAYCNEPILIKSGWHIHHIIQRIFGGSDAEDNLVLLHPNCHKSVHSNKFSFSSTPPRPPNRKR